MVPNQHASLAPRVAPLAPSSTENRGNLRLFFGGSRGVTAVCAMLEAARAAQRSGLDVVIGLMRTQGRGPIELRLDGFERLPPLKRSGRHVSFDVVEMSFDLINVRAARSRAPDVLLVDTHTGDPWADIDALLDAGINVWASLDATGFSSWVDVAVVVPARTTAVSLL